MLSHLNSLNPAGAKGALQPDKELRLQRAVTLVPGSRPLRCVVIGGVWPHQGTLCMRLLPTQRSMVCIRALLAQTCWVGGGGRTEMAH